MQRNFSALTVTAVIFWFAGAVDIGFAIGTQIGGLGALGVFLAGIGAVLNIQWMFHQQYDKECRAFDLGRGTVRPLRR